MNVSSEVALKEMTLFLEIDLQASGDVRDQVCRVMHKFI